MNYFVVKENEFVGFFFFITGSYYFGLTPTDYFPEAKVAVLHKRDHALLSDVGHGC